MEVSKPDAVNEELLAKSRTRSLDELRDKGQDRVKVIRASDVTSMISESVYRVLADTELLSDEDMDVLVQSGTTEFKRVFRERQAEREHIERKFREVQDDLHASKQRVSELEAMLASTVERRSDGGGGNADMMMRMMTEMAEMKVNLAQAQSGTGPAPVAPQGGPPAAAPAPAGDAMDGVASALDQITSKINDRLDQFGKKMGISSAVEGQDVNYESLFNDSDDTAMESNMGDVEVKKKAGGGIAGNLARLKKLKGGD